MIILVDIDGTICDTPENNDYTKAVPIKGNIKKINELYDKGYRIEYWTGRGRETGINWMNLTMKQFKEWGVKYHQLKFQKPYDVVIDNNAINVKDLDKIEEFLK